MFEESLSLDLTTRPVDDFSPTAEKLPLGTFVLYHSGYDCYLHVWAAKGEMLSATTVSGPAEDARPLVALYVEFRDRTGASRCECRKFASFEAASHFCLHQLSSLKLTGIDPTQTRRKPICHRY